MPSPSGKKPVIGLLGLPGSGKSHVASIFAEEGAAVIDADQIAHEVLDEPEVAEQLQQWWGRQIVNDQGKIDRSAIGRIVFKDSAQLARLEQLVHPRVRNRRHQMHARLRADDSIPAIIEDCPLLIEKAMDDQCDLFVLVDAPRAVRLQRLGQSRGWDEAELDRREKLQGSLDNKRRRANYVLNNDGEHEVHTQARRILTDNLQSH